MMQKYELAGCYTLSSVRETNLLDYNAMMVLVFSKICHEQKLSENEKN